MESLGKNNIASVHKDLVRLTLEEILKAGQIQNERLILWLGLNNSDGQEITELFVPDQINECDYFHLSSESMSKLFQHLRENNLRIIAQVHSHPREAFHSFADSNGAIIRHEGALSLVVPNFGSGTNESNFLDNTAVFSLSNRNKWLLVQRQYVEKFIKIS